MPRELALLGTEPVAAADLVEAGITVDGSLVPRMLFDGWITQLVNRDDVVVLSIELSRVLDDPTDVARLVLAPAGRAATGDGPWWWTEATAPWGPAGDTGVAVLRALAAAHAGELFVWDGR